MNTIPQRIEAIQQRLTSRRYSISEFLRALDIPWSTWRRWRDGETEPRVSQWEDIEAEIDRIDPPAIEPAAAATR